MLLCCFREPKEAKGHKKNEACSPGVYRKANEKPLKTTPATPISLSSTGDNNEILVASVTLHNSDHQRGPRQSVCSTTSDRSRPPSREGSSRLLLERAPLPKEAKRLLKQRSQESFKDNNKSVTSIPYIDASPPSLSSNGLGISKASNNTTPTHHKGWTPSSPNSGGGPPPGATSTPNLPTSTPVHGPIYASVRPSVAKITSETSLTSASNLLNGSSNQLSRAEEKIQGRGMCRSNASYGIQQMLQDQISKEEKENHAKQVEREVKAAVAKVTASYEERLSAARAEHSLKIQQVLRDKTTAVNNARNTFESELKRQLATFEKDLHELKSQNNTEMQKMEKMYTAKLRESEEEHQQVIAQYQARDESWQAEKERVLAEIQMLKDEANRFISILSSEDDPEKANEMLSPSKRQSLTREVESLQLVVEMRTAELHRLREERTRHLQQLEELENTKALLEKANARVEDLTVQLATKTELERQLSWEKSQLENFFQTETKNKTRISMQVEELQWRIKHNKELPPPQVFSPTTSLSTTGDESSPQFVTTSTPVSSSATSGTSNGSAVVKQQSWQQTPTIVMNNGTKLDDLNKNEEQPVKMMRPTTIDGIEPHSLDVPPASSCNRSTSEDSLEEMNNHVKDYNENGNEDEKGDQSKDSDDAGLSDEGLGDLTSEASNSPQPPLTTKANNNNEDAFDCHRQQGERHRRAEDLLHRCDDNNLMAGKQQPPLQQQPPSRPANNNYSLPTSPCDERVPSRIPFPKKQHKSQTNL